MRRLFALLVPLALAEPAAAQPPDHLALPIDCTPGDDCWVLRYVDHDPGPGVRDYMCGGLTGDGHKGTDIAIRDLATMAAGVEVRAAAAGVVDALRDGMPDVSVERGRPAGDRGQRVRQRHSSCPRRWLDHLVLPSAPRQPDGPARAIPSQAGQPLALVGLSGETSFPHVHFDVRHGERVVDPFVGTERRRRLRPRPAAVVGVGRDGPAGLPAGSADRRRLRHRRPRQGGRAPRAGTGWRRCRSPARRWCSGPKATGSRQATG